uniref:hypothetical protein n=1 Tax=Cellvibrio fontiphilus TaxID=1815559 RepID=UPI002B4BBED4|nr:hypothetical protein [Cellvibrio fontiphilus]
MNSRKFFSLFLLCALIPLAAAKLSLAMGWFSHHAVNKGYWLEREIELLPDAEANAAAWRLVYVAPESCTAECQQALYSLQQLYTGLGRKQLKMQPLVMAQQTPDVLREFSSIHWLEKNILARELQNQIVIVNRDGLALLRYPVSEDSQHMQHIAKDIRTDLLRLMNYDRSGT